MAESDKRSPVEPPGGGGGGGLVGAFQNFHARIRDTTGALDALMKSAIGATSSLTQTAQSADSAAASYNGLASSASKAAAAVNSVPGRGAESRNADGSLWADPTAPGSRSAGTTGGASSASNMTPEMQAMIAEYRKQTGQDLSWEQIQAMLKHAPGSMNLSALIANFNRGIGR